MSFRFAIVGDSNVKRHMSTINCRDRPLMSGAQIVPCGRLVTLSESIKSVRAKVNVVILSCVTNFITGAKNVSTTAALHVEPILTECLQVLSDACARFALLRLMGERHVAANPGTSFKVLGYEPRPLLKIFPAKGSDERVKTFNYVEAIQYFPTNFSAAELEPALFKVSPKLKGKVHQIFGVIDDEMVRRAHREREKSGPKGAKGKPTSHQAEAAEDKTSSETSGEEEEEDLSNAPPSSTRKRGASSALSGVAKAAKAGKSGRK